MKDRIKVSDWSQPIKLGIMITALGLGVWWGREILRILNEIKQILNG